MQAGQTRSGKKNGGRSPRVKSLSLFPLATLEREKGVRFN